MSSFRADPLKKKANYYSIKKDDANGLAFRLASTKDDSEAVARPYDNPKTGESGIAYERAFKALYGVISDVSFHENSLKDGTVLRSLHIGLGEDENGILQIISIPVDSRYATDFMKRLPNIDLSQEVRLMPYDFEKDGPRQVGISVYHKNPDNDEFTEKVDNNFFTKVEEKDGKKTYTNLYEFPEPTEEDAQDWAFYFKKVNKFLINYTKNNILPKFQDIQFVKKHNVPKPPSSLEEQNTAYPTEEISPDDIPF